MLNTTIKKIQINDDNWMELKRVPLMDCTGKGIYREAGCLGRSTKTIGQFKFNPVELENGDNVVAVSCGLSCESGFVYIIQNSNFDVPSVGSAPRVSSDADLVFAERKARQQQHKVVDFNKGVLKRVNMGGRKRRQQEEALAS